jgi:hypothetical protein
MSDDYDQTMEDDEPIPDPDPRAISVINSWLDDATNYGTDVGVIRDHEFTAGELMRYAHLGHVSVASQMLQSYRFYNYWMDPRCTYVLAHEGHYGPGSPWRIQSTTHDIPETTRRVYRLNQIRHITWEFFDHAKKEVKSFGAECRQALVQVDSTTTSQRSHDQRMVIRDYARDWLYNTRVAAQERIRRMLDTLAIPRGMRDEYMKYFFDGFWPYVEVMADEEVQILEALIAPPGP